MKLLMDAWKKYANTDSMNEGKKCRENVSCNCVTANSGLSTAEVQKFLASIYGTGSDGLRTVSYTHLTLPTICSV